jgi:hypothetical protein
MTTIQRGLASYSPQPHGRRMMAMRNAALLLVSLTVAMIVAGCSGTPDKNVAGKNAEEKPKSVVVNKGLRACANRRVVYVTRGSREALQGLSELPCAKSGPPIGAAS